MAYQVNCHLQLLALRGKVLCQKTLKVLNHFMVEIIVPIAEHVDQQHQKVLLDIKLLVWILNSHKFTVASFSTIFQIECSLIRSEVAGLPPRAEMTCTIAIFNRMS